MKALALFAVITSTLVLSACGKDSSKKKEAPLHYYHTLASPGLCIEVTQESLAAKGFTVSNDASPGECPQQTIVAGSSVSRFAACPVTDKDGVAYNVVYYTKYIDDDGEVFDMTILNPQALCQAIQKEI